MKRALLYTFTFLAIQFVVQFLVVVAYTLTSGEAVDDMPPIWNIAIMVLFSVATIAVFLKMGWASASRSYMRSRPWDVLLWSVVASLGAIVPSLFVQGLLPEWTGWLKEIADQSNEQLEGLMRIPGGYLVIALLPPVVEEMVFRGAILKQILLRQTLPHPLPIGRGVDRPATENTTDKTIYSPPSQGGAGGGSAGSVGAAGSVGSRSTWFAIFISALLFALVHLNPAQMPHAFLIGLLLGWMYVRTGSIIPGVAYHWANNTAAYVMFHVYHNPQTLTDIIGTGTRPLLLALLFSLCIFIPAIYQLNQRMKYVPE